MNTGSPSGFAAGKDAPRPLSTWDKIKLAVLLWWDFLFVTIGLRRESLARLVRRLRDRPHVRLSPLRPVRLGEIVHRVLRIGSYHPRCLLLSLVLFRLLRRQDTRADLVIGLAPGATSHEAHAWVEVNGEDVGPPPGRMEHEEMARYGG